MVTAVVPGAGPGGPGPRGRRPSEPGVRLRGHRDDFFLKVMAAAQLGDPDVLAGAARVITARPAAEPMVTLGTEAAQAQSG